MKAWGSLLFGIPSTLIFLQRQVKYKRTTELLWFSRSFVFHKASESKRPNVNYAVNSDGTIEVLKEEQTSLDVGDGVEEIEMVEIQVSKDTIDEFIKNATSLPLPDSITINPRDVLIQIEDGEKPSEVAAVYEMSEDALIDQIEISRQYFAPFADTWSKKKDEVIFKELSGDSDGEE